MQFVKIYCIEQKQGISGMHSVRRRKKKVTYQCYLNKLKQLEHAQSFDFLKFTYLYSCVVLLLQGLVAKEGRQCNGLKMESLPNKTN